MRMSNDSFEFVWKKRNRVLIHKTNQFHLLTKIKNEKYKTPQTQGNKQDSIQLNYNNTQTNKDKMMLFRVNKNSDFNNHMKYRITDAAAGNAINKMHKQQRKMKLNKKQRKVQQKEENEEDKT